jgi:hypothetical protein
MKTALILTMLLGREIVDEKAYQERMRDIDRPFVVLRKYREARRTSEIEEQARKLTVLFGEVETFWKGRGNEEYAGFPRRHSTAPEDEP